MPAPYTKDIAKKYKNFLDEWDWQCHITLTFRRECQLHSAMTKARTFLNKIGRDHPKMKYTAAILGTKGTGRNHVHILSTAKENDGKIEKNRREQRGRNDGAPSRSLTSS